ncbi:MAG: 23S rRNA (pseudouridine(1915)-N(3))-methyltransferase RlmH [Bacteroidales bacterium]|nr:23S rRNA (pseudouridine(1915)-N(3))-methyltransferase RlmH [Bacteroidales bacterium]
MKALLLLVGKTVDSRIQSLVDDYKERLKHYLPFEVCVIPELKATKNISFDQQKEKEGELLMKFFQAGDTIVLLDENGKEFKSTEFALWMQKKQNTVSKRLVFVIGGPYGFSPDVYGKANDKISLSRMTFSHQMVRLVFIEQLYRAMTILHGEPYHHE